MFYTLSLPLPMINELILYVYVVRRVKRNEGKQGNNCDCYGLTLDKNKTTLNILLEKLSKMCAIDQDRITLAEINGSRYVKMLSVSNINADSKIVDLGLRSRRLFAFEEMDTQELNHRWLKDPKYPSKAKDRERKKYYNSINDLKTFDVVDAQDYRGDWYRGIVLGSKLHRKQDYSIKIHFIEFGEKWDEFYNEENLFKIAPPGTYAEEPQPKEFTITAYHRVNQSFFEGIPIIFTLSSEMTWNEAYLEIATQITRYINPDGNYFKSLFGNKKHSRSKHLDPTDYIDEILSDPPFKISFTEATRTKWMFCSLQAKTLSSKEREKREELLKCPGWDMYRNDDKIKWLLTCTKNQSIYIEWTEEGFKDGYRDIECVNDQSAIQLLKLEAQRENGIDLTEWLDLFVKEDTLEDFTCDKCKKKSNSKIQVEITRLPEILIIHLKRCDLVNYPLKNLKLSNYCAYQEKASKNTYDLYGVCNHIQFNVAGGHYTSYIQYDPAEMKRTNPKIGETWYKWNDEM